MATVATKKDLVQQRAAFDLNCSGKIDVVELGNEDTYGASGCGTRATYVVACKTAYASDCTAIMNSDAKPQN